MIRKIIRTGLIQLALLALICLFCLTVLPHILYPHEEIWLDKMELAESDRDGKAMIVAYGGNLYRLTDLYLDGRAVADCEIEQMAYDRCRFYVDESIIQKQDWKTASIGKCYFGLTRFISNEIGADFLR